MGEKRDGLKNSSHLWNTEKQNSPGIFVNSGQKEVILSNFVWKDREETRRKNSRKWGNGEMGFLLFEFCIFGCIGVLKLNNYLIRTSKMQQDSTAVEEKNTRHETPQSESLSISPQSPVVIVTEV